MIGAMITIAWVVLLLVGAFMIAWVYWAVVWVREGRRFRALLHAEAQAQLPVDEPDELDMFSPETDEADLAFLDLVRQEWQVIADALPSAVKRGLSRGNFTVYCAPEPDPRLHPRDPNAFGDFVGLPGRYGQIGVYRGPVERYHAACEAGLTGEPVISIPEHVHRILLHELAHACGMSHEDLAPYGI